MSAVQAAESETISLLRRRIVELEERLGFSKYDPRPVTILRAITPIIADAAVATWNTVHDLVGPSRLAPIARVRFAIYWAARSASGQSLSQIGRAVGMRDHTTVIGGLRRAEQLRREDPAFKTLTDMLVAKALARPA